MQQPMTLEQISAMFGCTVEQARAQMQANAEQLAVMADKAKGGKYRGFTHAQLVERASAYKKASRS